MPTGVVLRRGYATVPADQMGRYFDAIGWFSLGLLTIGFIGGSVFWWTARTWRGPLGAIGLAAMTVVASGLAIEIALTVTRIRLPDPNALDAGATFEHAPKLWMAAPLDGAVGAPGILLILMPTMAVLVTCSTPWSPPTRRSTRTASTATALRTSPSSCRASPSDPPTEPESAATEPESAPTEPTKVDAVSRIRR